MRIVNYFDIAICEYALYSKGVSAAVACDDFHIKGAFAKINEKKILNRWRIQRANALHRKVIKSFRKNTQKEYKNLIFLLVED